MGVVPFAASVRLKDPGEMESLSDPRRAMGAEGANPSGVRIFF
jgi:hypothetical protein